MSDENETILSYKKEENPDARKGTAVSIRLAEPITTGGEEINFLDFRKVAVKDIRQIGSAYSIRLKQGEQLVDICDDTICKWIERLCGLGKDDANKLDLEDYEQAKAVILDFLPQL